MCPYDMIGKVGDECNASKKRMNFILRKCKASADYGCPEWHLISSNIFVQVILLVVGLVQTIGTGLLWVTGYQ